MMVLGVVVVGVLFFIFGKVIFIVVFVLLVELMRLIFLFYIG